jgi:hypothetical protein
MSVKRNGAVVSSAARSLVYSSSTETYNTDFFAYLPLSTTAAQNTFEVSIRSRRLATSYASQTFPAFLQFATDQHMPYLLVASVYEIQLQAFRRFRIHKQIGRIMSPVWTVHLHLLFLRQKKRQILRRLQRQTLRRRPQLDVEQSNLLEMVPVHHFLS